MWLNCMKCELYLKVLGFFQCIQATSCSLIFIFLYISDPKYETVCLPYLYYAKICSNERNCAPLESFCIFLRTLVKCQCQTHYNFRVFPLPAKRIYFLIALIYVTETNEKQNKNFLSCPTKTQLFSYQLFYQYICLQRHNL